MRRIVHIAILVSVLAVCGCTPQHRLNRGGNKHPHLIERADTAIVYDTIITAQYQHDTIYRTVKGRRDTFIVEIPGGGNTYIYTNEDKTKIEAATIVPADTSISETLIVSQIVDTQNKTSNPYKTIAIFVSVSVLVIILLLIFTIHKQ